MRGESMSSIRTTTGPPRLRALSQAIRYVRALPTCCAPVGEGARRPTTSGRGPASAAEPPAGEGGPAVGRSWGSLVMGRRSAGGGVRRDELQQDPADGVARRAQAEEDAAVPGAGDLTDLGLVARLPQGPGELHGHRRESRQL